MDFLEFARKRWSCRQCSDRKVEREKIDKILLAALIAPTAVNYQPQKIFVLQSEEALSKMRKVTRNTYNAPTIFLVCADTNRSWHSPFVTGYDSGEMDAAIVCTHMMLEAEDLGLGACWIMLFDPKKVIKSFNLPENIKPICLLAVGYKSERAEPYKPWHDVFREMEDIAQIL